MTSVAPRHVRIGLILLFVLLAPLLARALGVSTYLQAEQLRALMGRAGPFGPLAFVAVFVVAVVAQVPGFAFVLTAPALFHLPEAWLLCFVASNLAVILNFALVRKFGGQPLSSELERPTLRRLFRELDRHPIRTVAILRTLTIMFPPVTGALALTQLSSRDHALGSALGMVLPVTALLLSAAAVIELVP